MTAREKPPPEPEPGFNVATVVGPWMTPLTQETRGFRGALQCGHGRGTVDDEALRFGIVKGKKLQCGHGRGTVDDAFPGVRWPPRHRASMWPRSWDRG